MKRKASDVLKSTRREARLGRRAGEEAMGFAQAQATIKDDLLELVGKDEAIDCALLKDFGYHAKICDEPQNDCYGKEQRNKVKAELRKAIRNYFGEDV